MTSHPPFEALMARISRLQATRPLGRVVKVGAGVLHISGLAPAARIGDLIIVQRKGADTLWGEVLQLQGDLLVALPDTSLDGVALDDRVILMGPPDIAPDNSWLGRVIDPSGRPLDGRPLLPGATSRALHGSPPSPAGRRAFGPRLNTGIAALNTFLPIVRGQRMGLFAGSGVGKSSLLGQLAQNVDAEVVVIALIGERGRELRHFLEKVLGPHGLKRAVVVAATSDQSPLYRRRCAWTAMAVAEFYRDQGRSVLFLGDSVTRFAEAHREIAVAAGEAPVMRGYPASISHLIMSLCERAGPGQARQGDITAIFSVLVAGSDMEEPIADILRGVLDGHVILDRKIAEGGRYPAIDILRSVSRSLPAAASVSENQCLAEARKLLGLYARNEAMLRAGLYSHGADPEVDRAISLFPHLDEFLAKANVKGIRQSYDDLELILRRSRKASISGIRAVVEEKRNS